MTPADVDRLFAYRPLNAEQLEREFAIRSAARRFGLAIQENTLPSADQSAALRQAREAMATAISAIAQEARA